eukprot:gene9214-8291_t
MTEEVNSIKHPVHVVGTLEPHEGLAPNRAPLPSCPASLVPRLCSRCIGVSPTVPTMPLPVQLPSNGPANQP